MNSLHWSRGFTVTHFSYNSLIHHSRIKHPGHRDKPLHVHVLVTASFYTHQLRHLEIRASPVLESSTPAACCLLWFEAQLSKPVLLSFTLQQGRNNKFLQLYRLIVTGLTCTYSAHPYTHFRARSLHGRPSDAPLPKKTKKKKRKKKKRTKKKIQLK